MIRLFYPLQASFLYCPHNMGRFSLVQRLLKESSKSWDIDLLTFPVPEMMKYASLSLAASALMQAFDTPEKIKG